MPRLPILSVLGVALLAPTAIFAAAGDLTEITNFGRNPTNVQMFVYKPTRLASPPPLIVALHWCSGTAQQMFSGSQFANIADQKGYIVIYPDAPEAGQCWDVHTKATLTHDAGGDSLAIAEAVRYAIKEYGVDKKRVFATGLSSGAMMTNVLMGAYPDLFAAGSAYAGVPYGCFEGPDMWQPQCANGQLIKTAQQWGDQARAGYPGYTGTRPKFQTWHGATDSVLYPQNFFEQIKQWTNVLGISSTPTSNLTNTPVANYWCATFGNGQLQANFANGVGHEIWYREGDVLDFFGLSSLTPAPGPGGEGPGPTLPPVAQWGQCGGINWTGSTACVSPFVCTVISEWFSQCK
ncbi:carbohydrate esterase family 1 protein [Pterulicium gracile]|uniref:Carboxylic ester hydrolase n=1 Tax=Pterulicium gracile TaxID=1884261 RepID=A0A5C3QF48_9AGAR|nr:carbohydrate esterase family 1 protein [Pterula gracilis]